MTDVETASKPEAPSSPEPATSPALPARTTWWSHLTGSIQDGTDIEPLLEIELLTLSFATGMQDYQCFASNQTGNTVLFAVAAAGLARDAFSIENVGVSLGVFAAGCVVTGQVGHRLGPRRRVWLVAANLFSTALIFAAAAVQYACGVERTGPAAMAVVALLAFGSGAQVAMARPLNIPQITTAMATAAYVDLFVDPKLSALRNHHRDRRLLFIGALAVGSFAGAFAAARVSSAFALLVSAILKLVVSGLFYLNKSA